MDEALKKVSHSDWRDALHDNPMRWLMTVASDTLFRCSGVVTLVDTFCRNTSLLRLAALEGSMEAEDWMSSPSTRRIIERGVADALTRNGVNAVSALSDDVRARATIVWPPHSEWSIRIIDDANRTLTLDAYINEKKSDPDYASSFNPSQAKPRICVTDQQALFGADVGMVARGEIEIVDDREGPRC